MKDFHVQEALGDSSEQCLTQPTTPVVWGRNDRVGVTAMLSVTLHTSSCLPRIYCNCLRSSGYRLEPCTATVIIQPGSLAYVNLRTTCEPRASLPGMAKHTGFKGKESKAHSRSVCRSSETQRYHLPLKGEGIHQ